MHLTIPACVFARLSWFLLITYLHWNPHIAPRATARAGREEP
jgi:hypothetical protein